MQSAMETLRNIVTEEDKSADIRCEFWIISRGPPIPRHAAMVGKRRAIHQPFSRSPVHLGSRRWCATRSATSRTSTASGSRARAAGSGRGQRRTAFAAVPCGAARAYPTHPALGGGCMRLVRGGSASLAPKARGACAAGLITCDAPRQFLDVHLHAKRRAHTERVPASALP